MDRKPSEHGEWGWGSEQGSQQLISRQKGSEAGLATPESQGLSGAGVR